MSIAVALLVPLLLGAGADALFHSSPAGVLLGLLIGIGAACYVAFSRVKRFL